MRVASPLKWRPKRSYIVFDTHTLTSVVNKLVFTLVVVLLSKMKQLLYENIYVEQSHYLK